MRARQREPAGPAAGDAAAPAGPAVRERRGAADARPGRQLARVLAGSWRRNPPSLEMTPAEFEGVARLVHDAGAAGLGWWRVRGTDLGRTPAARTLQQAYLFFTAQAAIHAHRIRGVFAALRAAGVEPLLVKGWAVARLYPEPGLRPYSDVDLCVRPREYEAARRAIDALGLEPLYVDLHKGFSHLDSLGAEELFARSRAAALGGTDVRVLSPEDHLRVLCSHFLAHGASRARWLCDIALAVESRPADFDWDLCLGGDRRRAEWVRCCLALARELLGAEVSDTPAARGPGARLPTWLVPAVLKQWESRSMSERYRTPMGSLLSRPVRVLRGLRHHWPNPVEATVGLRRSFTEFPRLPLQLGTCLVRGALFLARVPNRWRV